MLGFGFDITPDLGFLSQRPAIASIGTFVSNPFDSGDWTTVGNPYVTFASDGITFNGAPGGLSDYIYLNNYTDLAIKRFGFTATLNANSFLEFGLISRSVGASPRGYCYEVASNGNSTLYSVGLAGTAPVAFGGPFGVTTNQPTSPGDVIQCYIEQNNQFITIGKKTNNGSWFTQTFDTTFYNISTNNLPNICTPFLMNVNCNMKFTNIYVSSTENKNVERLCIGDSITQGAYAGSYAGIFGNLISASINAGGAEFTQDTLNKMPELIMINPRKAFLLIGLNDRANGVSSATWQANIVSIVNQLEAAGITVIKLLYAGFGSYSIDVNAFITATYPTSYIDTCTPLESSSGVLNAAYDSGDSHPNAAGHTLIANTILNDPLY